MHQKYLIKRGSKESSFMGASVMGVNIGESLGQALNEYENHANNIHKNLLGSVTPNYEHEGGASDYVYTKKDSVFVRTDYEQLQKDMSYLYNLQQKINALMTVIYSVVDIVSGSTAIMTGETTALQQSGNQSDKVMNAMNNFSNSVKESITSISDIFYESVSQTNQARYKVGMAQIENQYSQIKQKSLMHSQQTKWRFVNKNGNMHLKKIILR